MFCKIIITDSEGKEVFTKFVDADNLLLAGIMAEEIFDLYHLEHPCEKCTHDCRVSFGKMKGD